MHFPQYSSVCSRFGLNNISCVKNLPYLPFLDFCRSNSLIMNGKRNSNRLVDVWKMSVSPSPSPSLIFHPITTLRQYRCPATAMSLSRYGNIVVLLRQHCCSAAIIYQLDFVDAPGYEWKWNTTQNYPFFVIVALIYLSFFFYDRTFYYFCGVIYDVWIWFHSLRLQVNRLSNLKLI